MRRHFKNFLGQIFYPVEQTAAAGDENAGADVIDERFIGQLALEQVEYFTHPQVDDRIQCFPLEFFTGETGIVFQQYGLARQAIAESNAAFLSL